VPLTKLQSDILGIIARLRNEESFIAGGIPINRASNRYSSDIDVFHDREERVADAALTDTKALSEAGFSVRWLRQQPAIYAAEIELKGMATKLEWVADSDFRFFPVVRDDVFGFVLQPIDLCINKVMAAASRREPRDLIDLLTLHQRVLPIGAAIWAAAGVAPGFTPEGLIAEIRRNARYPAEELSQLTAAIPVDPDATIRAIRAVLNEAEMFIASMPSEKIGFLFLEQGRPVQPEPAHLGQYTVHGPQRRGHWPSSPEITSAMLDVLKASLS
jgi:hypothetical protein